MQRKITDAKKYVTKKQRRKIWHRIVMGLACVVVFCTVYALILPAIAMENCGLEEHTHTDECYEQTLICGQEESGEHTHTDACYESTLTCGLEEHTHSEECYSKGQDETTEESGQNDDTTNIMQTADDGVDAQAIDINSLEGQTFALINNTKRAALMPTVSSGRLGSEIIGNVRFEQNVETGFYTVTYADQTEMNNYASYEVWNFQRANNGTNTYYLYTTSGNQTQYVRLSQSNTNGTFSLVNNQNNATTFTVVAGSGSNEGLIELQSGSVGINLYQGTGTNGFAAWNAGDMNNYFYLVTDAGVMAEAGTVEGVSPSGTVINMFDYWATYNGKTEVGNTIVGDYSENAGQNLNVGINNGHNLKFTRSGSTDQTQSGRLINVSDSLRQGIVNNTLTNGYPTLNDGNTGVTSAESLDYLFDPDVEQANRNTYRNVNGLLQIDDEGYYYYDSQKNYAELGEDGKNVTLYDTWGVFAGGSGINGQFFPFDKFEDAVFETPLTDNLNHYFGMTLTSRFIQQYDGHTDSSRNVPMEFTFSGDDDVWIFIDDVLVGDLGGIRGACSVSINFSTGAVTITDTDGSTSASTTIYQAFNKAGEADSVEWRGTGDNRIFENNTYHTLKFFYLERGNSDSNLSLKYNLSTYPSTGIYKVNQYGDTVPGATFAVYAADESYNYIEKEGAVSANTVYDIVENGRTYECLYSGVTDANGEMVFVDADQMPYTLAEIQDMFGDHFILKEVAVPEGYRLVGDEIHLRIANGQVLTCDNTYETGVWASPTLQVTAPNTLQLVNTTLDNGGKVEYYNGTDDPNGTVFAVVLKYIGSRDADGNAVELEKEASWAPVYGTDAEGFTVATVKNGEFIATVIDTAKRYVESNNVFSLSASGQMQGGLSGMPSDVSTYYHMLGDDEKGKTEYTVAYYWTQASSLDEATANNTYRINSETDDYPFDRAFGATIEVPNLINRLAVQKQNEDGTLIDGAKFAMYSVTQDAGDDTIWYSVDGNSGMQVALTSNNGDNTGEAKVKGGGGTYNYSINENGVITVTDTTTDTRYTVTPYKTDVTQSPADGGSSTDSDEVIHESGTASFENMTNGYYVVREVSAPEGYRINTTEMMVLVDDTAVYANAGTEDDGISVARGPGYIVSTLDFTASQGEIDNTLSWVYQRMLVSSLSTSYADVYTALDENGNPSWDYLKANNDPALADSVADAYTVHLKYDKGGDNTLFNYTVNDEWYTANNQDAESATRRLYTSVGWSYYLLYQDTDYGSANKSEGAEYTDLSGQEISNLFSRSTFIRVTDEYDRSLSIQKVDGSNNTTVLPGAEFTLTRTATENGSTITYNYAVDPASGAGRWEDASAEGAEPSVLTTSEDGMIHITASLRNGTYTLTETKAPDGYKLPEEAVTFTVTDGTINGIEYKEDADDANHYIITVTNSTGIELPHTGGRGTYLYTFGGLLLIATALMYGYTLRRRREGRIRK